MLYFWYYFHYLMENFRTKNDTNKKTKTKQSVSRRPLYGG